MSGKVYSGLMNETNNTGAVETTCMIEDGYGNMITTGLEERVAMRTAQKIANKRGESVYLWMPNSAEAIEVDVES